MDSFRKFINTPEGYGFGFGIFFFFMHYLVFRHSFTGALFSGSLMGLLTGFSLANRYKKDGKGYLVRAIENNNYRQIREFKDHLKKGQVPSSAEQKEDFKAFLDETEKKSRDDAGATGKSFAGILAVFFVGMLVLDGPSYFAILFGGLTIFYLYAVVFKSRNTLKQIDFIRNTYGIQKGAVAEESAATTRSANTRAFRKHLREQTIPNDKHERAEFIEYLDTIEQKYTRLQNVENLITAILALIIIMLVAGKQMLLAAIFSAVLALLALFFYAFSPAKRKKISYTLQKVTAYDEHRFVEHTASSVSGKLSIIDVEIEDTYWHPDFFVEKLQAEKIDSTTYKICSIPFAATNYSLGDIVEVNSKNEITNVIEKSNLAAFRIATASADLQDKAIKMLGDVATLHTESFNEKMFVAAIEPSKTKELIEALNTLQQKGLLLEFQQSENQVNNVKFSKRANTKYISLLVLSFLIQAAGVALALYVLKHGLGDLFKQMEHMDPNNPTVMNVPITVQLAILAGFVIASSTVFIQNWVLDRTVFLRSKISRDEKNIKLYALGGLICALCSPLNPATFFGAFIFAGLASSMSNKKPLSGSSKYWNATLAYIIIVTLVVAIVSIVILVTTFMSSATELVETTAVPTE